MILDSATNSISLKNFRRFKDKEELVDASRNLNLNLKLNKVMKQIKITMLILRYTRY